MPYTAPAWNAVDFDFTGAPSYTAPAWNAVDFDFSAGGGSITGTGTSEGTSAASSVWGAPLVTDPHWVNVVLAMHMDESPVADLAGHTVTASGSAGRTSVNYPPLADNIYSCYFPGSPSRLNIPTSTDFDFGAEPFSISLWCNAAATNNSRYLLSTDGWNLYIVEGQLRFDWIEIGGVTRSITPIDTLTVDTWNYLEVTYDGSTLRLFLNGSVIGSYSSGLGTSVKASSTDLVIGAIDLGYAYGFYWDGYVDDIRITKGICRNTSTYVVPWTQFPPSTPTGASRGKSTSKALAFSNGTGSSVGTSSASGANGLVQGVGTSTGSSTAVGKNSVQIGTGSSAGTSTAIGGSIAEIKAYGLSHGYAIALAQTYRDKGTGYSFATSTGRGASLSAIAIGKSVAGSVAHAYNPYRQGVGRAAGIGGVTGIGRYVIGAGRAVGRSTVTGRSPMNARGTSTGTSAARAISRRQGVGQSIGGSQAVARSTSNFGTGASAGISIAYGISYPMRVYPEEVGDLSFVRTTTPQSVVWTES